ncbi:MAG: formyltransferase family protein [Desulfovibrio sp.]
MSGTSLPGVAILAVDSNRSRMYLHRLAGEGLLPSRAILLHKPEQRTPEDVAIGREKYRVSPHAELRLSTVELLEQYEIPTVSLSTIDPNDPDVVEAVAGLDQEVVIYSGPGGALLRDPLLEAGKRFLHVHPGIVPDFRGSTTVYYMLLAEGVVGATAFFLNKEIDKGDVVAQKRYPAPADRRTLDLYYDPWVRAQLLAEVLERYRHSGTFETWPQSDKGGETYFIVHPVLKHIAMLAGSSSAF